MRSLPAAVLAIAPICMSSLAYGQAPDSLSFQGYLTDSAGVPLDTMVDMSFKLYKGATEVWSKPASSITVSGGVFNVTLGGNDLDTVAFNQSIDLGITVGGNPEISPRTPLESAAFARALPGLYTYYEGGSYNVVGGASINTVASISPAGVRGGTISGGGGFSGGNPSGGDPLPNRVLDDYGTVGGGMITLLAALGR